MKITTWNVNGIRAALGKGLDSWVEHEKPEVLCLQEVKAKKEQLPVEKQSFSGYEAVWNSAQRPGYSGVASFFREKPAEIVTGIGEEIYDVEGRVIRSRHPDFLLYNIYFPNGQRGQGRVDYKLDFYARLLKICDEFHDQNQNIIITGDFNTAHREIDLANPKSNSTTSGFLPEERVWIDHYLEHNFVDAYRWFYPDRVEYTWWTYLFKARERNVGWRLDYFLVSKGLMDRVKDVVIHGDVSGSDHCPVSLIIE